MRVANVEFKVLILHSLCMFNILLNETTVGADPQGINLVCDYNFESTGKTT